MIYLLDIILLGNLIIAYKSFKTIVSPPVLMGGGMLIASLVATLYYDEFDMESMVFDSVLILGFGTMFYTICCILLRSKEKTKYINKKRNKIDLEKYKVNNLIVIYYILDIMAIACVILKMYSLMSYFGSGLAASELIYERAQDGGVNGSLHFQFPIYVTLLAYIGRTLSFFTFWLLSLSLLTTKKRKYKRFQFLLIIHTVFIVLDGVTQGVKDAIFDPLFRFILVFLFVYFAKRSSMRMNKKIILSLGVALISVSLGFKSISAIIGKVGIEDRDTSDMFAEYLGAEIKNFDIYIQGYDGNPKNKYWGESTFSRFYMEIIPNYRPTQGVFQDIGRMHLGNVYTQWYHFHKDFDTIGLLIMTFVIAFVSMMTYNYALKSMNNPAKPNLGLFLYSSMGMCIFMSFFSTRFTQNFFTLFFLRRVLVLWFLIYIFNHHTAIIKKSILISH